MRDVIVVVVIVAVIVIVLVVVVALFGVESTIQITTTKERTLVSAKTT